MDINVLVTLLSSIYCWLVTLFLLSTHSSFFFFSLIFNFLCVLSGFFFFLYKVWTAVLCYLKESRCAAGLFLKLRFPIPEIPFAKCLFPGCCFPVCLFQPGDVCDTDCPFILLDRPTGKLCLYRLDPSCFASYFALCHYFFYFFSTSYSDVLVVHGGTVLQILRTLLFHVQCLKTPCVFNAVSYVAFQ